MNKHRDPEIRDHESDPAHTPGSGWVDEGGASHLGPATHLSVEDPPQAAESEQGETDAA